MADKDVKSPANPAGTKASTSVGGTTKTKKPHGGKVPAKDNTTTNNDVPAYIAEQNKQKSNNLTKAKDWGQLTATTAMSVVHIALLKELLVTGPDHARFYHLSLALICTCLILQVIAGIIALTTSYMKSFYSKYQGNAFEDVFSNICCCTLHCRKSKDNKKTRHGINNAMQEDQHYINVQPRQSLVPLSQTLTTEHKLCKQEEEEAGCCPCYISTDLYPHIESDILYRYDNWVEQELDIEIQAAEAKVHVARLKEIIQEAKIKLGKLETKKDGQEEDLQERAQEIKDMLFEAQELKESYQDVLWIKEISRARGDLLWQQSHEIREYHMLKTTTFWQQVLNYIFYIVFVLNAFITGLGIAGTERESVTTPVVGLPFPPTNNSTM